MLYTKEHDVIRGSGRCQVGFSIYDALTECKDTLIQFGGHELAAGLSILEENIQKFTDEFEEVATKRSKDLKEQIIDIDMQVTRNDMSGYFCKMRNKFLQCKL